MTIKIELPTLVINNYNEQDSAYLTIDAHILDLIDRSLTAKGISLTIKKQELLEPVPNLNDEMVRYELDLEVEDKEFKPAWILESLEAKGYEKGLTIKDQKGNSLYHDEYTADIALRRKTQEK